MFIKILFLIIYALLISACVPRGQIDLTKLVLNNIESSNIVLFVPQNNIIVRHPKIQNSQPVNSGTSAGVVPAMFGAAINSAIENAIESANQREAERQAEPIRQTLQSYDFRTVMTDALSNEVSKADRFKFNLPIRLETTDSESQRRIILDESKASTVLFNQVSYELESGNLVIYALIDMYPTPKNLTKFIQEPNFNNPFDMTNEIYRKLFIFNKQMVTSQNIKESLAEGAANIAKQITADLNHPI